MKIPQLQSLRLVFMLLIVASHLPTFCFPAFDAGGDCGVAFFFLLSGYVTMMSRQEKLKDGTFNHKEYIFKNLKRIYPLYIITWLVAVLLVHNLDFLLHALPSIFLVQSWIPDSKFYFGGNAVGWFLSTLLLAWIALPLLYRIVSQRYGIMTLIACYILIAAFIPDDKVNAWLYVFPPVRLVDFALGMALYLYPRQSSVYHWYIGFIGVIVCLFAYPYLAPQLRNALLFWPFIGMMIVSWPSIPPFANRILSHPYMVFLGNHTMEIFLTHQLLIRILVRVIQSLLQFIR